MFNVIISLALIIITGLCVAIGKSELMEEKACAIPLKFAVVFLTIGWGLFIYTLIC